MIERFEKQYMPEPNTGCLLWLGAYFSNGYGAFWIGGGKTVRAHRFSYETYVGKIPEGLCVLHKCDTPICVNPEHLFLGTDKDNAVDRNAKNRHAFGNRSGAKKHPEKTPRGESSGVSKLKAEDILEIRKEHASGSTQKAIAEKYGICHQNVSSITKGRTWKHVK